MMFKKERENTRRNNGISAFDSGDFHLRVQAGLRQAPVERAKAIKDLWNLIFKN